MKRIVLILLSVCLLQTIYSQEEEIGALNRLESSFMEYGRTHTNDTVLTADFYIEKIKKEHAKTKRTDATMVMRSHSDRTKQLYSIYMRNQGKLYKLVTVVDKAVKSEGIKIKEGETYHLTIIPMCERVWNGMPVFDQDVFHPFEGFDIKRVDSKYGLDSFYRSDDLDGLYIKTNDTPLKTYKKALQIIENSKEYKEFIKQRVGKRGKYIVMTKIFDFQEEALMFKDLPDDLDSIPLVYADYYEDTGLRRLNRSKKGIIIICFSKIFKNYFTITVNVARHELSNPQIEDLWFTGREKIFLLKQTDHGIQIIKTTEAYAD